MPPSALAMRTRQKQGFDTARLTPRIDQQQLATSLIDILSRADHAYLEAPTGFGKTVVLALAASSLNPERVIYLAHTTDLVDQFERSLEQFHDSHIIADQRAWTCMTWQAYFRQYKKGVGLSGSDHQSSELIIVDECHRGGSITGSIKTFTAIKESGSKIIWCSATPWRLDEDVLGPRFNHTAHMPLSTAFRLGLLNQTNLVRIDCGLRLRGAVAQLERTTGRSMAHLSASALDIEGDTASQTYQQLEEEVQAILNRPIRTSDVSTITRHRWRLMADLYLTQHYDQQAIFWLPNQKLARDCAAYISERLPLHHRAEAIVTDQRATVAEQENTISAKALFLEPGGPVRVACVVFRLREGFDAPSLALGFDCSWSPRDLRNAVQKIGRLTRIAPNKPVSTYYYAVDVKTIAGTRQQQMFRTYVEAVRDALQSNHADARFAAEALLEADAIHAAMNNNAPTPSPQIARVPDLYPTRHSTSVRAAIPLFSFEHASGYQEISRTLLDKAFVDASTPFNDLDIRSEATEFIEALRNETNDVNLYRARTVITAIADQRSPHYAPDLAITFATFRRDLAKAWKIWVPQVDEKSKHHIDRIILQSYDMTAEQALKEALKFLDQIGPNAPTAVLSDDAIRVIMATCNRKSSRFDFVVCKRLHLENPAIASVLKLKLKPETLAMLELETEIANLVLAGAPRPSQKTPEGQRFTRVLTQGQRGYRPDIARRFLEAKLYRDKRQQIEERKAETARAIEKIIGGLERGEPPPPRGTPERRRLDGWLSPGTRKTRQDLRDRVAACQPNLIPRGVTYAERDSSRSERVQDFIDYWRTNQRLPPSNHRLAMHMQRWRKAKFWPEVRARFVAADPQLAFAIEKLATRDSGDNLSTKTEQHSYKCNQQRHSKQPVLV